MWYWIFRAIFLLAAKLLFHIKVQGLGNIPEKTNFIIVSNHNSYLDPLIIMAVVPKRIYCIALRFLYKVFLVGWFLNKIDALPVGSASQKALYLLEHNKNVGLFPEGGLSRDGSLREFRRGAALLAYKTGRPIVPCAVVGTFEAMPVQALFPKLRPVRLKIGKPIFVLKEFDEVINDIYLQEATLKVRDAIKEMLDAG